MRSQPDGDGRGAAPLLRPRHAERDAHARGAREACARSLGRPGAARRVARDRERDAVRERRDGARGVGCACAARGSVRITVRARHARCCARSPRRGASAGTWREAFDALRARGGNVVIFALWHGSCCRCSGTTAARASRSSSASIATARSSRASRDAFGCATVRGSTSRGGARALLELRARARAPAATSRSRPTDRAGRGTRSRRARSSPRSARARRSSPIVAHVDRAWRLGELGPIHDSEAVRARRRRVLRAPTPVQAPSRARGGGRRAGLAAPWQLLDGACSGVATALSASWMSACWPSASGTATASAPRARAALAPLSLAVRRRCVGARRRSTTADAHACIQSAMPALSVGNLTVGGTGKTPMAAWRARRLRRRGARPAIVLRGYGDDEPLRARAPESRTCPSSPTPTGCAARCAARDAGRRLSRCSTTRSSTGALRASRTWCWWPRSGGDRRLAPAAGRAAAASRSTALRRASVVDRDAQERVARRARETRWRASLRARAPTAQAVARRAARARRPLRGRAGDGRGGRTRLGGCAAADASLAAVAAIGDPRRVLRAARGARAPSWSAVAFPDHHAFTRARRRAHRRGGRGPERRRLHAQGRGQARAAAGLARAPPLWYVSQRVVVERGRPTRSTRARARRSSLAARARPAALASTAGCRRPELSTHGHRSSTADVTASSSRTRTVSSTRRTRSRR